jgi:hypothetical protein
MANEYCRYEVESCGPEVESCIHGEWISEKWKFEEGSCRFEVKCWVDCKPNIEGFYEYSLSLISWIDLNNMCQDHTQKNKYKEPKPQRSWHQGL